MGVAVAYNPCEWCPYKDSGERCGMCELTFSRKGWISVKDRMPEEKLEKITYASQDIATGEIVESEERMSYVSEIVAVLDYRHMGEGEFELVPDYDVTYNGHWGYNMCVKYWMPLPEAPKTKGSAE